MRKGDTVTVYRHPISETDPEGKAKLVKPIDLEVGYYEGRVLQYWFVQFVTDAVFDGEPVYQRAILAPLD